MAPSHADPPDASTAASAGRALDHAVQAPGRVEVTHPDAHVEADVEASGPVGIRLRHLKVQPKTDAPVDLHARAADLARRVRPGGERLQPVEIDPVLGGGNLRTAPEDMRGGRYFQVDITPSGEAEVKRLAVDPQTGDRVPEGFDLTRRQLEELIDGLAELPDPEA